MNLVNTERPATLKNRLCKFLQNSIPLKQLPTFTAVFQLPYQVYIFKDISPTILLPTNLNDCRYKWSTLTVAIYLTI